jgi:hypothetical protein
MMFPTSRMSGWALMYSIMLVGVGLSVAQTGLAKSQDALHFEIAVNPEARRHIAMLQHPPYLALALENIGMRLTSSGGIKILDANSLQYKTATVRFVKLNGNVYFYEAKVDWDIGMLQTTFTLPVEADISELEKGKVSIRVSLPLAKLIPEDFLDRIKVKVQSLADANLQKRMLDYFNSLEAKRGTRGIEGIFNEILVEAYNSRTAAAGTATSREPGDAEPLSDQLLLLITLAIWLIVVPLAMVSQYFWRKFREQRARR